MTSQDETRSCEELAVKNERLKNDKAMLTEQLAQAESKLAAYERADKVANSIDGVQLKTVSNRTRVYQRNALAGDIGFAKFIGEYVATWIAHGKIQITNGLAEAAIEAWKAQQPKQ